MKNHKSNAPLAVERVSGDVAETDGAHGSKVIVRGDAAGFAQEIHAGPHRLVADEAATVGGTDTGASPYDLLLAALGSCTSMTVAMYARRKQWPLRDVTVSLRHSKVNATEGGSKTDRIERDISFTGLLSQEQRSRLIEIANKCPLYRTLTSKIDIRTIEV